MPFPLFAFGLTSLPMLGWLAAAAAPILIHLWSRRQYREMSWAAMEFLLAAIQRHTRRLLFEQWLLLLIRTLIIVLLVLAAAQPFWESPASIFNPGGKTHRVLVLDGSYSMAYKPTEQSRFDRAKELVRQIVEESREGDGFSLVLMTAPPQAPVARPAEDSSEILREIADLPPPCATLDLQATVAAVEQILETAGRAKPRLTRHEVYFITDLQRVGWDPQLKGQALIEFRRRSAAVGQKAMIVVIDVGQPAAENLAVTGLRSLEPAAVAGREVNLEAVVHNFGRQSKGRQPVELWIDGRRMEQKFIEVPAGGDATAAFAHRFEAPGDRAVEVRAPGDALEVDNSRYLSLPVRQAIRVLCIDGRPSGERFRGAADYVAAALSPEGQGAIGSPVQVDTAAESALAERDLTRYDCLFLCNVAQFTANEARLLRAYLQNGGNAVFLLGDRVLADRYNHELGVDAAKASSFSPEPTATAISAGKSRQGRAGEGSLLPAHIGTLVKQPQYRLDALDFRHPILRTYRGRGEAALLTTPVFQYYKLEIPKGSAARKVLALANGDPLVVEEAVLRGRVVLMATSAEVAWSGLPLWPSFVPLIQEVLAYCVAGGAKQRNFTVGEPIAVTAAAAAADAPTTVQTPDGRTLNVTPRTSGEWACSEFAETDRRGFYTVQIGSPSNRRETFAANVDPKESDLAQFTPEELRAEVWPGVPFVHQTTWQNAAAPIAAALVRPAGLQVELLYIVLVFLLFETFLAWRFGHRGMQQ
ncbi:MAG: BatA and WFA domain-containing protein [Pirellulales bacterium]|nr:BatA and WFA domain-containing protein [Pirellulales bacterium]